ncbi:hypothetical protein M8J76_009102 [Diaphorina citri]|nr:hypothetical protein M8J76_009102 [Diaphorina citri]
MKIIWILGVYMCVLLPFASCEHLYLQLIKDLYKSFENIIMKMDQFKIMQCRRDLGRYRAYKYLLHNFTGPMNNMWLGAGVPEPSIRRMRLQTKMVGVEGNEYYTKFPRLYEFRNENRLVRALYYSVRYWNLRRWNCSEAALRHVKSIAPLIPEVNLTLAFPIFNEFTSVVTTPYVRPNRTTLPWKYGLEKLARRQNATNGTTKFPRRKLTLHMMYGYSGVFREFWKTDPRLAPRYATGAEMPIWGTPPPEYSRLLVTVNPPKQRKSGRWTRPKNRTRPVWATGRKTRNRTHPRARGSGTLSRTEVSFRNGTSAFADFRLESVTLGWTRRYYGRQWNSTGIERRKLFKCIPQVPLPWWPMTTVYNPWFNLPVMSDIDYESLRHSGE